MKHNPSKLRRSPRALAAAAPRQNGKPASFDPLALAQRPAQELQPAAAPKLDSVCSAERARINILSRMDPLPNLTPELLVQAHSTWRRGYILRAAVIWYDIAHTDDRLKTVIPKREKGVTRHGWEVIIARGHEQDARAQRHKEALEFFYGNLQCTHALDLNRKGGIKLLLKTMMSAVGMEYAAHEIVWDPRPEGLTARLNFVPLWFFENTTGRLRFLPTDWALYGDDCPPGEWLITVGDGLMRACAVLYKFKHMPLQDWLMYCEKQAVAALHGETTAAKGTQEWNDFWEALVNFNKDMAILTSPGNKITPLDISQKGELAYPKLIEWCDAAMAALWRGGDLSTQSHHGTGQGQGASLQDQELELLEQGDAEMLTDTLNEQLDPFVIRYALGDEVCLANIRVKTGVHQDVKADIETDSFLLEAGFPMSLEQLGTRYNRTLPDAGETLIRPPAASRGQQSALSGQLEADAKTAEGLAAANAAKDDEPQIGNRQSSLGNLVSQAVADTLQIRAVWIKPFFAALEKKAADQTLSDAELLAAIEEMAGHLPELMQDWKPAQIAKLVEGLLGAGVVHGLAASVDKGVAS